MKNRTFVSRMVHQIRISQFYTTTTTTATASATIHVQWYAVARVVEIFIISIASFIDDG